MITFKSIFDRSKYFICSKNRKCLSSIIQNSTAKTVVGHRRRKVCIVGAGPAGFYAAQYILKNSDSEIDLIEKLPVPFGLVRFGVAPDHPEVKNVINTFTKTAENPRVRFFGNLSLGQHISLQQLRDNYDAVLLTYGADKDRKLNIPNEDDPSSNVISAREFVAWYNGFPGMENLNPNLSGRYATIVGQGNVAVDVARILLSPVDSLKSTDITDFALEALSRSEVQYVHLVGRRGPLQAAFTIKELREMLKLSNVQTEWRMKDFEGITQKLSQLPRPRKRLTELMLKSLMEQSFVAGKTKKFLPIFMRAPILIERNLLHFNVTRVKNENAIVTDEIEKIPSDLILRSIGYKSISVDEDIFFDDINGLIFNKNGCVLKNNTEIDTGLYVAGWLATGPTGVILNTMNGAYAVARTICNDIATNDINQLSTKSGIDINEKRVVTWDGWKKIDKFEVDNGKSKGKPREKITDIEKMLQVAGL